MLIAGIDEAGWGPKLGPLCVASTLWRIDFYEDQPDLWTLLAPAIHAEPGRTAGAGVCVADSKLLIRSRTRHQAGHIALLERSVLALDMCRETRCGVTHTDPSFLELVGSKSRNGLLLPVANARDAIQVAANRIRSLANSRSVSFVDAELSLMQPEEFNHRLASVGKKSVLSFELVAKHIDASWRRASALKEPIEIIVDRQGGRVRYAQLLSRFLPGSRVRVLGESPEQSLYELAAADKFDARIEFRVQGDATEFAVAHASMIAKYARELEMLRFNREWSSSFPELKPTAGYGSDANRWISEVEAMSPRGFDRDRVVRRA